MEGTRKGKLQSKRANERGERDSEHEKERVGERGRLKS